MSRNYRREYDNYQGKPDQIKNRAQRNAARREMEKSHGKEALAGKDVGHKRPIKSGGSNAKSNLRVESVKANRSRK